MDVTMQSENRKIEKNILSGSTTESVAGAAAVVLTILGLVNVTPGLMLSVATMALGVALLFDSAMVGSEYAHIMERSGAGALTSSAELGGGLGAQGMAGLAAFILGLLSLLSVAPDILTPSAAIVLGAGLVFGSGVNARINSLRVEENEERALARRIAQEAVATATGAQILVGLSAAVLGILALIGFAPLELTLVAMLAVASSVLLSGAAISGRIMALFRQS